MIVFQRTIKNAVQCEGIGLHSGRNIAMAIKPAPADTGVVFLRSDQGGARIEAAAPNTAATSTATTLRKNGVSVQAVEHLLGAFAGLGISNAVVELSGDEVPTLDGSAGPFIRLIIEAGIRTQNKIQPVLKVTHPVVVRDESGQLAVLPAERTSISYFIGGDDPLLQEQGFHYTASESGFIGEVADARTFGFLSDLQARQAGGQARGGPPENAAVPGPDPVLHTEGLRFRDEGMRHQVLDIIGDLSLVGMPVIGHVIAHQSGHRLNALMVNRLLHSSMHWVLVGDPDPAALQREAAVRPEMVVI